MPGPVRAIDGRVSEQLGRRQLTQAPADRSRVQAAHTADQVLGQRPTGDRERLQHRPPLIPAAAHPRHQQLRQPGGQHQQAQPADSRASQRSRGQLLGEEGVALGTGIQLICKPRRC